MLILPSALLVTVPLMSARAPNFSSLTLTIEPSFNLLSASVVVSSAESLCVVTAAFYFCVAGSFKAAISLACCSAFALTSCNFFSSSFSFAEGSSSVLVSGSLPPAPST